MIDESTTKSANQPLVSVVVITYNSSKYVLETLESIKDQTYKNIEQVVSDDCSTDNTVSVVEDWVEKNKDRFVAVEVVKVLANTGIAPNCNRGLYVSRGEWIKLIAGDDLLLPNCISESIHYLNNDNNINVVFSRMMLMTDGKISISSYPLDWQLDFFLLSAADQNKLLVLRNYVWLAPAAFMRRVIMNQPVYFDEKYPFCEDYPLWFRLTASGVRLHYFDKYTVVYRQGSSVSRSNDKWWNINYYRSVRNFYFMERRIMIKDKKLLIKHSIFFILQDILILVFKNKRSFMARKFNRIYCRLLHPVPP